jgi:hypothetical protein
VIVRETYQDAKFAGRPSFPIVRKRDVEFRPYSRESLVTRDSEAFVPDEEELEEEPASRSATLELEDEDGMHEVDDEEPEVDFNEDTADLGAEEPEEDDEER